MKNILLRLYILTIGGLSSCIVYAQLEWPSPNETVLTNNIDNVAGSQLQEIEDPLREGSRDLAEGLKGIYNAMKIQTTGSAWELTTNYIKGILNYFLGIIGLIALGYMIFQGFRMLTAGSNEEEVNKAKKGIKYAIYAIFGVGLSWFILSIIFWFLQLVTTA